MEKNIYGSGEATTLKDASSMIEQKPITFGKGTYTELESKLAEGLTADGKVRFVYDVTSDEPTGSGLIFVDDKLASSKILDITTNAEVASGHEVDGVWVPATEEDHKDDKKATKVIVTWFGTQKDQADGKTKTQVWKTEFDLIDTETVQSMIDEAKGNLDASLAELENQHVEDTSRLDSSVSGIEELLNSSTLVTAGEGVTVTPTEGEGFTTYEVKVNVDDDTVKLVDNKLTVATYAIEKVSDASLDEQFASQYKLMATMPDGTVEQLGDTIDIAKDWLVKTAHVCTFNYPTKDAAETIKYGDATSSQWGEGATAVAEGDNVIETQLPWAKLDNGEWEQAVMGKGIKYGRTYLHLVLNTKNDDYNASDGTVIDENDLTTDVFLDFTEIFKTFQADEKFVTIENGKVSLKEDAVVEYVDASLGITEHFDALDSSTADQEERIETLEGDVSTLKDVDSSIINRIETDELKHAEDVSTLQSEIDALGEDASAIKASYVQDIVLIEPSEDSSQFSTIQATIVKGDSSSNLTVDVPNKSFYEALNETVDTLSENDAYLHGLLTWGSL